MTYKVMSKKRLNFILNHIKVSTMDNRDKVWMTKVYTEIYQEDRERLNKEARARYKKKVARKQGK